MFLEKKKSLKRLRTKKKLTELNRIKKKKKALIIQQRRNIQNSQVEKTGKLKINSICLFTGKSATSIIEHQFSKQRFKDFVKGGLISGIYFSRK